MEDFYAPTLPLNDLLYEFPLVKYSTLQPQWTVVWGEREDYNKGTEEMQ